MDTSTKIVLGVLAGIGAGGGITWAAMRQGSSPSAAAPPSPQLPGDPPNPPPVPHGPSPSKVQGAPSAQATDAVYWTTWQVFDGQKWTYDQAYETGPHTYLQALADITNMFNARADAPGRTWVAGAIWLCSPGQDCLFVSQQIGTTGDWSA